MRKDKQPEISVYEGASYKENHFYINKLQGFKKSLFNIVACSASLFLFWFIVGQFIWTKLPYKSFLFAFITMTVSLIAFYVQRKMDFYTSDFPLIKLFAKSSLKKPKTKSSKSVRKKS